MDPREAEFRARLMETFLEEADEHLKAISSGLLQLEKGIPDEKRKESLETIFREAHSLKGAARAVNLIEIQDICQEMETVLSDLKSGRIKETPALFDSLYTTLDIVKAKLFKPEEAADQTTPPKPAEPSPPAVSIPSKQPPPSEQPKKAEVQHKPAPKKEPAEPPKPQPAKETQGIKTIRVSTDKLDKLLQDVEEMLTLKMTFSQRLSELEDFMSLVNQWNESWAPVRREKDRSGVHAYQRLSDYLDWHESFFYSLKDKLKKSLKFASQDFRLVGGMVDSLLEETKRVLMQPFSTLFEVLPRMVRDISQNLGKEVELELQGGDTEVDKRILEELKDPLLHLIRNCIDHGIETPQKRTEQGKQPRGLIRISASEASGNKVMLVVSDDGKGIDIEKIKSSAVKTGILSSEEASQLSQEDALRLIFKSGISTSPIITELSGRGIGMGIAEEKVVKLGGEISIESLPGKGTTFRISLPLTLATFRGILVSAGSHDFILPTHNLKSVIRLAYKDVILLDGKRAIISEMKHVAFSSLAELLGLPSTNEGNKGDDRIIAVLIKAGEYEVALGVDQIHNEQEVFVKGFGRPLYRVRNISAATVMEWGKVVPILDPFDLAKSVALGSISARMAEAPEETAVEQEKKTVLIAEDSVTARTLLKNIMSSAGFNVITTVDGAEAFSQLKTNKVDLLMTDVEMPRMDGFELTRKVRGSEGLKEIPIIICTSRGSREDRERGIEAGANAYIDKSSFAQSSLLDIIKNLL